MSLCFHFLLISPFLFELSDELILHFPFEDFDSVINVLLCLLTHFPVLHFSSV